MTELIVEMEFLVVWALWHVWRSSSDVCDVGVMVAGVVSKCESVVMW